MQIGETYDLHFNESRFGSGHRSITVMTVGRKWITGIDHSTLVIGKIAAHEWQQHKPRLTCTTPRQQAIRIEKRIKIFRRLGVAFAKKTVKRFAQELRTV